MTATATIEEFICVRPATSTDFDLGAVVNTLLAPVYELPGAQLIDRLTGNVDVGRLISDAANEAPDDLYATTTDSPGLDNRVWPQGDPIEAAAGARIPVGVTFPVEGAATVFLWEKDDSPFGNDDKLGSVTIDETEQGQGDLSKIAFSEEEKSCYYVSYHVD
ncbi:hypothetical protein JCM4814A_82710 [Streptomyces phaeofaciens JCM 4814]|uniref:Uncharacterized protein n=1 Tax=Streptomyces phaeofaciens TaxID=68254 RepID=A0A918HP34_9ACTN|nr:hypothetical protein [Streptomyces phaeofaciens]GGT90375.1 hypothetical protein GCM10010226_80710 [Streptomyces phaeofaciens]